MQRKPRTPLHTILFTVNRMNIEDRCAYLIACIKCEREDSERRRELSKALVHQRTTQIQHEVQQRKVKR